MKAVSKQSCILLSKLMDEEKQAIRDYRNAYLNTPESKILKDKFREIEEEENMHLEELLDLWERGDCKIMTSINV